MQLPLNDRIQILAETGRKILKVLESDETTVLTEIESALHIAIMEARFQNPWFTTENVRLALMGIAMMLQPEKLKSWLEKYSPSDLEKNVPLTVAVIMAGNIPFVAFHDMLCVLLSGHRFLGKLSSQDTLIPRKVADLISEVSPDLGSMIDFHEGIIDGFDAVIATGSNNSRRYFEYYFGKYPHIIRGNRSSVAVLTGNETNSDIEEISDDIFRYFGLGCRNVSQLLLPKGFEPGTLPDHFSGWVHLKDHHKYYNNYEYRKAVMLINSTTHLDNGFCLLLENASLASPIGVIHYHYYSSGKEAVDYLVKRTDEIQCVVSHQPIMEGKIKSVLPGQSQFPDPEEYADDVDTISFLSGLTG